jgi:hypothetical protein
MKNPPETPTSITQIRRARALTAEMAAQRRDTDRLCEPEFPEYVQLCVALTKGSDLTAAQRIGMAGDMYDFAESHGMPMSLAMCEAFFEHIEACALASVAECRSPGIVLAFRTRKTLS